MTARNHTALCDHSSLPGQRRTCYHATAENPRARAGAYGMQVWMKLGTTGFFSNRLFPTDGLGEEKAGWHYVYPVHEVSTCLLGLCMPVPYEAPGIPPPFICRCPALAQNDGQHTAQPIHLFVEVKSGNPCAGQRAGFVSVQAAPRVHSRRVSTT